MRGLHPKAPWTTTLRLRLDGYDETARQRHVHDDEATPDADGRCSFPLPTWYQAVTQTRLEARDPNYVRLLRHVEGIIDPAHELLLDVQVVAIIEGRVVDKDGRPVPGAGIGAFAIRDGEPTDPVLAGDTAKDDGRYRLGAPPDVPLLLVALPFKETRPGRYKTPQDLRAMRSDLLPVTKRVSGAIGVVGTEDFVLPDATPITGVVRWQNGRPVENATVIVLSRPDPLLRISDSYAVHVLPSGAVLPLAQADTDQQGQFRLPGVEGAAVDVSVRSLPGDAVLLEDFPTRRCTPPRPVELTVTLPITLRVRNAGAAAPHAELDFERTTARAGDDGELAVVTTRPVRVRATREGLQSPWITLLPESAGTAIDLELRAALTEVAIEFEGEFRVRNTTIAWRSDDGREGREHLVRDDNSGPFRLFLPPGRYHLSAGPGGGERNGIFLLPVERDVEVGQAPRQLTLPALFGGRFTVHATDSSGLYIGGTCRVVDASGKDVTDRFTVQAEGGDIGAPGELLPGSPNDFTAILPAGEYLLTFDFRDHGAREHRLVIRPREVAEVRVRL
ncbi:MAG TPA: hypothetical protein VF384_19445 [Planctomycetota bacterium]